jgi:ribosomal-protein-serine acetyltransferase
MDPLLIEMPMQVETERWLVRCPRPGDGAALNAAVVESIDELRAWMPWAQQTPTVAESEAYCRRQHAKYLLRDDLAMLIFERAATGAAGRLVGATGFNHIDWPLRSFQIGYWRRTGEQGRGLVTEAVRALADMAFRCLAARRVELRTDARNRASQRVAERAGFTLEGVLRSQALDVHGEPRDTHVYATVREVPVTATAEAEVIQDSPNGPQQ